LQNANGVILQLSGPKVGAEVNAWAALAAGLAAIFAIVDGLARKVGILSSKIRSISGP